VGKERGGGRGEGDRGYVLGVPSGEYKFRGKHGSAKYCHVLLVVLMAKSAAMEVIRCVAGTHRATALFLSAFIAIYGDPLMQAVLCRDEYIIGSWQLTQEGKEGGWHSR